MALITLEEAKRHLRIDHNEDDKDLNDKIEEASAMVLHWIEIPLDSWQTQDGMPDDVPFDIRAATKIALAILYRFRGDESQMDNTPRGENAGVLQDRMKALLRHRRGPAMA